MKVIVKRVGMPASIVDVDYTYRCDCGKLISSEEAVTKEYVDIIPNEFCMVVDEDGLPKELPLNFFIGTNNPFYPTQPIVGTVVFCRYHWENPWEKELWDFELLDVTEEDVRLVEQMLDKNEQRALGLKYLQEQQARW